jgi:hypothetical protein
MDTIDIATKITDPDLSPPSAFSSAFAFLNKNIVYIVLVIIIIALIIYTYLSKKAETTQPPVIVPSRPSRVVEVSNNPATPTATTSPTTTAPIAPAATNPVQPQAEKSLIETVESNIAPIVEINVNESSDDD